jgi:putative Mg2+ transporter-C (MgtC) family protein
VINLNFHGELLLRIVLAFFAGILLGLEREKRHKPAGLRTHALVSMGAALFTIISAYGFTEFVGLPQYGNMDPSRIAAQIVAGVGFIGGGIIFKEKNRVRGLTTAASIWLTAGVGTGIGAGMYTPMLVAVVLAIITLKLDRVIKRLGFETGEEE